MEDFKKKIQKRIWVLSCMGIISILVGIYDVFVNDAASRNGTNIDGIVGCFTIGLIIGLGLLSIANVMRFKKAMNDETQLKLLYNKENDERMKDIRSKAGMPMVLIMSIGMIIAGIIASKFSSVVFYTLIATAFVQLLTGTIIKLYYMKTM